MKSRYLAMKESKVTNKKGENYPDVLSFSTKNFKFNDPLKEVMITQAYKERFYLICFDAYGITDYDDIILWMNGVSTIHIIKPGETILLPSKKDLKRFIIENKVER